MKALRVAALPTSVVLCGCGSESPTLGGDAERRPLLWKYDCSWCQVNHPSAMPDLGVTAVDIAACLRTRG
jgi:hypothetical protein